MAIIAMGSPIAAIRVFKCVTCAKHTYIPFSVPRYQRHVGFALSVESSYSEFCSCPLHLHMSPPASTPHARQASECSCFLCLWVLRKWLEFAAANLARVHAFGDPEDSGYSDRIRCVANDALREKLLVKIEMFPLAAPGEAVLGRVWISVGGNRDNRSTHSCTTCETTTPRAESCWADPAPSGVRTAGMLSLYSVSFLV